MDALAGVTVLCWLMGTATGPPEQVAALHDGRLRMLWEKLVDTPVRGVVHEAAGPLPGAVLARGRAVAEVSSETWRIPLAVVEADPLDHAAWRPAAEKVLKYGATSWAFLRAADGRLDFIQLALFPNKGDFDRYWYSDEIAEARALAQGLYQVPVLPSYWEVSGIGELQPEDALS